MLWKNSWKEKCKKKQKRLQAKSNINKTFSNAQLIPINMQWGGGGGGVWELPELIKISFKYQLFEKHLALFNGESIITSSYIDNQIPPVYQSLMASECLL